MSDITINRSVICGADELFTNTLPALRGQLGEIPIQSESLTGNLDLLMGPGGNVLVLSGKDGRIVVDTFVKPAWDGLQDALKGSGLEPIQLVINTHWHFDHTDNNAQFRSMGVPILACAGVSRRLSEAHNIDVLHLHFPPSPQLALPTQTFSDSYSVSANDEVLILRQAPAAHTDTDVFVHFENSNVIHCGDIFVNYGGFPVIDIETGGNVAGMIEASNRILNLADSKTRIVPGHGTVADKATLLRYRDRLATVHDRIAQLKAQGRTLDETIAVRPLNDLLEDWGSGLLTVEQYTELVYRSV